MLHPRSDNTRCCPADSSWACPPGSRRIDVYSYKVPARPEAKSALQGRGTGLARWWATSAKGRDPRRDSVRLRRKAVELSIPCITAVDTAASLVDCLRSEHSLANIPLVDIATLYRGK